MCTCRSSKFYLAKQKKRYEAGYIFLPVLVGVTLIFLLISYSVSLASTLSESAYTIKRTYHSPAMVLSQSNKTIEEINQLLAYAHGEIMSELITYIRNEPVNTDGKVEIDTNILETLVKAISYMYTVKAYGLTGEDLLVEGKGFGFDKQYVYQNAYSHTAHQSIDLTTYVLSGNMQHLNTGSLAGHIDQLTDYNEVKSILEKIKQEIIKGASLDEFMQQEGWQNTLKTLDKEMNKKNHLLVQTSFLATEGTIKKERHTSYTVIKLETQEPLVIDYKDGVAVSKANLVTATLCFEKLEGSP